MAGISGRRRDPQGPDCRWRPHHQPVGQRPRDIFGVGAAWADGSIIFGPRRWACAGAGRRRRIDASDASHRRGEGFATTLRPSGSLLSEKVSSSKHPAASLRRPAPVQPSADRGRRIGTRYLPSGHLVYGRLGTLFVVPFDAASVTVTGPPVPVVEDVLHTEIRVYDCLRRDILVYVTGPALSGPGRPSLRRTGALCGCPAMGWNNRFPRRRVNTTAPACRPTAGESRLKSARRHGCTITKDTLSRLLLESAEQRFARVVAGWSPHRGSCAPIVGAARSCGRPPTGAVHARSRYAGRRAARSAAFFSRRAVPGVLSKRTQKHCETSGCCL